MELPASFSKCKVLLRDVWFLGIVGGLRHELEHCLPTLHEQSIFHFLLTNSNQNFVFPDALLILRGPHRPARSNKASCELRKIQGTFQLHLLWRAQPSRDD